MQDSLNYDGLKHFYLLSSQLSELNNLKAKSGSIATIVDTGAEYMYEESSNQWHLQPSSGGGGVTPEQLAAYIKDYAIKNEPSTPSTDSYSVGNVIFDQTDGKIKLCGLNTSEEKVWIDVTAAWLGMYKTTVLDESYPSISDVILITNQLPVASEELLGKFYLLRTDNKIYRCENTGTLISPVWGWVEKLCLAIDNLPSSDIPQTLDNDKKFYLTEIAVTKDEQAVTDFEWFKLTDNGKRKGYDVSAEGLTLPGGTIQDWEEVTQNQWMTFVTLNYFIASSLKDADVVTGYVNGTWFMTYIGNVNITPPKLLYEDKNGVQVVVALNSLEQILQAYQEKITAGTGLVFDGNTLKHSNSVASKPQRYIRATAYDAQGHAINFGADYLVSRTDNNDDILSDSYLSSTLWVNKHYQSIVSTLNVVSPDDCLFNFPLSEDVTTGSGSKVFFTQLTNLITGGTDYGFVTIVEKKNGNGNFYFEQTFKKEQQGNASSQIVYYRKGSILNNTDVTVLNVYENRALITWGAWCPVEYPTIYITKESVVDEGSINFKIHSGMGIIDFSALVIDEFANPSAVLGTLPAGIQAVISETKHYIGNNNGDMHGLNVTANGNLQLWKKTGDVFPLSLSGTIIFPIGY